MIDSNSVRAEFPSLNRRYRDLPMVFLDGPGGTQIPNRVIEAITNYYTTSNSNTHGEFITTQETDQLIGNARKAIAVFLGAENEYTISIGQNMTTLNYSLAHGIGRLLKPGEEVLITQLDHEGNRGPWLMLREYGIKVREVLLKQDGTLDYEDFSKKINENTRLVAMGMASNALGTVNDVKQVRQLCYKYNTWLLLDAVAYAPHFCIDVQAIGCDFLLCSSYKFYGPHAGILYSRPGLLDRIPTDRLHTNAQTAPACIETGTLNHATIAGIVAAIEFLSDLGNAVDYRQSIVNGFENLGAHEHRLATRLSEGLKKMPDLKLIGQDFTSRHRAPTVSFTIENRTPQQVCKFLAEKNICAWDGHFYAQRAIEVLGLFEKGGVTRLGISVYNTESEIDFVLSEMERFFKKT